MTQGTLFIDRLSIKLNGWLNHFTSPCTLEGVSGHNNLDRLTPLVLGHRTPPSAEHDADLQRLESSVARRKRDLDAGRIPFTTAHNGTATLGRLCYAVCRALRPRVVVESGVAYGVTSAYILQALASNSDGTLLSIDLPPLASDAASHVGYFIPDQLRRRWKLRVGSAQRLLPPLLEETGPIDLFIHDSLHTYTHMKWEFKLALDALRPGGVIIADDIEGNRAFEEAVTHPSIDSWFAIEQEGKSAICGVMRKKFA